MGKTWNETAMKPQRELAREKSSQCRLVEYQNYNAVSALYYIKPLFNKVDCQVKDRANDKSRAAGAPYSNDFNADPLNNDELKPNAQTNFIVPPFGNVQRDVC